MQLVKSSANAWSDAMQPVVLPKLIALIEAAPTRIDILSFGLNSALPPSWRPSGGDIYQRRVSLCLTLFFPSCSFKLLIS